MDCPSCSTANPDEAAFCMKCGTKLAPPPCVSCGADVPAGAAFCMKCGTRVGDGPAPAAPKAEATVEQYIPKELLEKLTAAKKSGGMQGERRTVTMLFCDVQGSTAAAEQLDPEEWAEIMNGAFDHLIAPIYRYEGMLARLMGDAILAFFGAPISHEDDPERAALAALAIINEIGPYQRRVKARWGIEFNVRVGINTGLVVVGEVGSDMRLEYTAMGDEVNLASRMESTAEPGTVQVSEATHKLIAPLFDTEPLGEVNVKGKRAPVNTWRVLRKKIKPGRMRGLEGLDSPMIGRDRELGELRGVLGQLDRGAGQAVSVLGEAGLGKSRLMVELRRQAEDDGVLARVDWLEARSVSYETGTPYAPFVRVLRRFFNVAVKPSAGCYAQMVRLLDELSPGTSVDLAPYLAHPLGVPISDEHKDRVEYLEPPDLRANVDLALVTFFETLAARRPTVLVLEDLHWADRASIDIAKRLLELPDRSSLMLVALFRPRRSEEAWSFHEVAAREYAHRYSSLQLSPLSADDGRQLIENLLHIDGLGDELKDRIVTRADGNPLFVEELIRSLIDRDILTPAEDGFALTGDAAALTIPDTLQGVLNTRLDQLEETTRRVAQTAAVLGRDFAFDTLASLLNDLDVVNEALASLMKRGLMREVARLPQRRLAFKHALLRDAAYESLLKKARRELHHQAAEVLVKIAPEEEARIGDHFLQAREPERALPHLLAAGEHAAAAYANEDAARLLGHAVDIAAERDDVATARRAFEALGEVYKLVGDGDKALELYNRMLAYAQAHDDGSMHASALNKRGFVHLMLRADMESGNRDLEDGMGVAEEAGCKVGQVEASMVQCGVCTMQARFDDAYSYLDRAVQLGEELKAEEPRLYGMAHISNTLVYMTEIERARPKIEETLALAAETGNKKYEAEVKAFPLPFVQWSDRHTDEAVLTAEDAVALSNRIGAAAAEALATWMRGSLAILRGEYETALAMAERSRACAKRGHIPWMETSALCALGTTYLQISTALSSRALAMHEQAAAKMAEPLGAVMASANWCELGFCAMGVGKLDTAIDLFERALSERSPMMFICEPHLHVGLATAHILKGALGAAELQVSQARASMEKRQLWQYEPLVDLAEAQLAAAKGDRETAREHADAALKNAAHLGYVPMLVHAAGLAARACDEDGETDEAAAYRARGEQAKDQIAAGISDADLRAKYLAEATGRLSPG